MQMPEAMRSMLLLSLRRKSFDAPRTWNGPEARQTAVASNSYAGAVVAVVVNSSHWIEMIVACDQSIEVDALAECRVIAFARHSASELRHSIQRVWQVKSNLNHQSMKLQTVDANTTPPAESSAQRIVFLPLVVEAANATVAILPNFVWTESLLPLVRAIEMFDCCCWWFAC